MNKLIVFFLLLISNSVYSTNYYVSGTGSDSNTGLSDAQAWATPAKVSAFSYPGGTHTVFFKRGYVYSGSIISNRAGMTYDAYGTGAKPIISGLSTVTGWVNLGGNIWEAPVTNVKSDVNLVLRDNIPQQVGRFPNSNAANSGYYSNTAATSTSITGPALSSVTNWTGAQVAIRVTNWEIVKATVLSHTAGTITFPSVGSAPRTGYGYFFQRDPRTLDIDGEWWYDVVNSKIRVYAGNNNPSLYTYQISTIDTLFYSPYGTTHINNIKFTGSNKNAVRFLGGTTISVNYCDFDNNGAEAIQAKSATTVTIDNCNINNTLGTGIYVINTGTGNKNFTITNNIVDSTAMFAGMEHCDRIEHNSLGVLVRGGDNVVIQNNRITYSGWAGMEWQGNDVYVKYNYIDNYCSRRADGGGIYTVDNGSYYLIPARTNRNVISNIVVNGIGANNGTDDPNGLSVCGLYSDQNTANVIYDSNTVAVTYGRSFHGNNTKNLTFSNNTFYNNIGAYSLQRFDSANLATGFTIKKNILYPYRFIFRDLGINFPSPSTFQARIIAMGMLDSNYYYLKAGFDTSLHTVTTNVDRSNYQERVNNFSYIQNTCLQEVHSTRVNAANIASTLQYNASATPTTDTFNGFSKKDIYGNVYNNSAPVPAWGSIILLDNGSIIPINPVANAGPDKTVTLPSTSVSVTGSGTDADGTIVGYTWVQVSGTTASISTPLSATTNITGLTTSGTRVFQLTVTDNNGLTGTDIMQVLVNPAIPPPNTPPVANAGANQTITLPTSSVSVSASGSTDSDGTIVSYLWTKLSGGAATITTANNVSTTITGLTTGVYVFNVLVTDNNGATSNDAMQVIVNPAPNVPPTANAGTDTTITLPTNSTTLNGSGSDADGTIVSYLWAKMSGPAGTNFVTNNTASIPINNLVQGVYQFQLTVTDNVGASATDIVIITVNANPNTPPVLTIRSDTTIILPVDSVLLYGSATDDGTIAFYAWAKLSGPLSYNIANFTQASTMVTNLIQGVYVFQLTSVDNLGLSSTKIVTITVSPSLVPPSPVSEIILYNWHF